MQKPQVSDYLDYRHFLSDLYHYLKEEESKFSYRSFAKAAGMNSPSFLKLVVDGKRNLTDESIEKFAHALRLNNNDSEYFRTLVKYNQSKSTEEKMRNYKWLQKLKVDYSEQLIQNSPEEDFWNHWFQIAQEKLKAEGHPQQSLQQMTTKLDELKNLIIS